MLIIEPAKNAKPLVIPSRKLLDLMYLDKDKFLKKAKKGKLHAAPKIPLPSPYCWVAEPKTCLGINLNNGYKLKDIIHFYVQKKFNLPRCVSLKKQTQLLTTILNMKESDDLISLAYENFRRDLGKELGWDEQATELKIEKELKNINNYSVY